MGELTKGTVLTDEFSGYSLTAVSAPPTAVRDKATDLYLSGAGGWFRAAGTRVFGI